MGGSFMVVATVVGAAAIAAGRGGRGRKKKKNICRRERKGSAVDPSGRLVAKELLVAQLVAGTAEREGGGKKWQETGKRLFFPYFEPDFLHFQAMKSNLIYRGWKRIIFSSLEKIFGP
jgi:hypothetical protein